MDGCVRVCVCVRGGPQPSGLPSAEVMDRAIGCSVASRRLPCPRVSRVPQELVVWSRGGNASQGVELSPPRRKPSSQCCRAPLHCPKSRSTAPESISLSSLKNCCAWHCGQMRQWRCGRAVCVRLKSLARFRSWQSPCRVESLCGNRVLSGQRFFKMKIIVKE